LRRWLLAGMTMDGDPIEADEGEGINKSSDPRPSFSD